MQRTLLIALLIVGCDYSITAAQAQNAAGQPAAPRIRIAVAGGLLGQLDGFPELPTHGVDVENGPVTERVVHGGLDGLSAELAASADQATLLLLGGHNLPHNVTALSDDFVPAFLTTLGAVAQGQATVVGVTNEDVNRLLRGINPEQLADWFKKYQVPFVASNLAIRYSKSVMNRIA